MGPYVIYADCEAIIKNVDYKDIHEISGFTIAVVSQHEKTETITYRGEDAGEVFMKKMEYLSDKLYKKIMNANKKMIYTDIDKKKFQNSRECHICDKPLPNGSTKTDHLANIGPWLKTMGLRRCMPTLDEVENKKNHFKHIKVEIKKNHFKHITDEDFERGKKRITCISEE